MVPGTKVALLAGRMKLSRSVAALRLIQHDGVNCDAPVVTGSPSVATAAIACSHLGSVVIFADCAFLVEAHWLSFGGNTQIQRSHSDFGSPWSRRRLGTAPRTSPSHLALRTFWVAIALFSTSRAILIDSSPRLSTHRYSWCSSALLARTQNTTA